MLIDIHERIKKLNKEQFRKKSTSYKKQKKKKKKYNKIKQKTENYIILVYTRV